MTDFVTPTDASDADIPAPEELEEVEQGARMDPHGDEPQDDPLPEGIGEEEGDE